MFQYWVGSKIQDPRFHSLFWRPSRIQAQAGPYLGILKGFQCFNIGGSVLAGSKIVLRHLFTSDLGSSSILKGLQYVNIGGRGAAITRDQDSTFFEKRSCLFRCFNVGHHDPTKHEKANNATNSF